MRILVHALHQMLPKATLTDCSCPTRTKASVSCNMFVWPVSLWLRSDLGRRVSSQAVKRFAAIDLLGTGHST